MRAGEDPEPVVEGGDPACWAHLVEDDEPRADGGDDGEDPPEHHDD